MISTTTNYNKPNFGMAVKIDKNAARDLPRVLTKKGAEKLKQIADTQKNNPNDVIIKSNPLYENLRVSAVGKSFYPNNSLISDLRSESTNIVKAVKKAAKYADEYTAKQNLINSLDIKG